jgi:hypothetical protein
MKAIEQIWGSLADDFKLKINSRGGKTSLERRKTSRERDRLRKCYGELAENFDDPTRSIGCFDAETLRLFI